MIKLTIDILNSELDQLIKNNNTLEVNKSYSDSYNEFVKFFKNKDYIDKADFIIGTHLIYGWMPKVLNLDLTDFENDQISTHLSKVKNGNSVLDEKEIWGIIKCVNRSMVGTSKLLHFINPDVYAIWDSKIFNFFFPDKVSTSGIEKPVNYLKYLTTLKDITLEKEFNGLYSKITEFLKLDYEISKLRAVESLIFEIVRNRDAQTI